MCIIKLESSFQQFHGISVNEITYSWLYLLLSVIDL